MPRKRPCKSKYLGRKIKLRKREAEVTGCAAPSRASKAKKPPSRFRVRFASAKEDRLVPRPRVYRAVYCETHPDARRCQPWKGAAKEEADPVLRWMMNDLKEIKGSYDFVAIRDYVASGDVESAIHKTESALLDHYAYSVLTDDLEKIAKMVKRKLTTILGVSDRRAEAKVNSLPRSFYSEQFGWRNVSRVESEMSDIRSYVSEIAKGIDSGKLDVKEAFGANVKQVENALALMLDMERSVSAHLVRIYDAAEIAAKRFVATL